MQAAVRACEDGREKAAAAMRAAQHKEGSEVTERMKEVVTKKKGPVVYELFKILNEAMGQGRQGQRDDQLATVFEDDDKRKGVELRGPEKVREEAARIGARIHAWRQEPIEALEDLMAWLSETRKRRAPRKRGGDWVDEVCTWDRFRWAIKRMQADTAVGEDGWSAYLLKQGARDSTASILGGPEDGDTREGIPRGMAGESGGAGHEEGRAPGGAGEETGPVDRGTWVQAGNDDARQ